MKRTRVKRVCRTIHLRRGLQRIHRTYRHCAHACLDPIQRTDESGSC